MRHTPRISLVCAGLTGILASGSPAVEQAFTETLGTQGIVPGTTAYSRGMVRMHRALGQAEIDIFRAMFPGDEARAQAGSLAFARSFDAAIDRGSVSAPPGAEEVLDQIFDAGLRLCIISGFSRPLSVRVLRSLGWYERVALLVSTDDSPRGCPFPDPVLTAMLRLGVDSVCEAAVACGTESVVESGCRAGAGLVAGLLTGPHSEARLRGAGATHVLPGLAELPETLIAHGDARAS